MLEYGLVIGREEVLWAPPWALAFNHGVDGDVADPDLPHSSSLSIAGASVTGTYRPFKLKAEGIQKA